MGGAADRRGGPIVTANSELVFRIDVSEYNRHGCSIVAVPDPIPADLSSVKTVRIRETIEGVPTGRWKVFSVVPGTLHESLANLLSLKLPTICENSHPNVAAGKLED